MSRLALILALPLVLGIALFAQDTQSAPAPGARPKRHAVQRDRAETRLRHISKRLNLTDQQQDKLRPILQDESNRVKEVDDNTSLSAQERHKKLKEIHRATRLQMEDILTDEQKKLLPAERPHGAGQHGRRHQLPKQGAPSAEPTSPQ